MRLFHCTTCGADLLKGPCPHHPETQGEGSVEMAQIARCPGFTPMFGQCTNLVRNDIQNATHVALGQVCCSAACHASVYDLENYLDGEPPVISAVPPAHVIGAVQVDEGLRIGVSTGGYHAFPCPP